MLLLHRVVLPVQIRFCSVLSCPSASVITVLKHFSFLRKIALHICHFKPRGKYTVSICRICSCLFNLLIIFIYLEFLACVVIVKLGYVWSIDFSKVDSQPLSSIGWILTVSSEHTCWLFNFVVLLKQLQPSGSRESSYSLSGVRGLSHTGYAVHPRLMASCWLVML